MNTEQLGRLLTALEAIAAGTARIADALEARRGDAGPCMALAPDGATLCVLNAGHRGAHSGRTYPPDQISTGLEVAWTEDLNPKGPYA